MNITYNNYIVKNEHFHCQILYPRILVCNENIIFIFIVTTYKFDIATLSFCFFKHASNEKRFKFYFLEFLKDICKTGARCSDGSNLRCTLGKNSDYFSSTVYVVSIQAVLVFQPVQEYIIKYKPEYFHYKITVYEKIQIVFFSIYLI